MPTRNIGKYGIDMIIELEGPRFEPWRLLPDCTPEILKEHASWLVPRHYDPETDLFVAPIQSFLLKTPHHTILIDGCFGNHKDRPNPMANQLNTRWLERLAAAGATPEDIDIVLCSHLHPDHVGWNTKLENGQWVPTFPNAKYLFAEPEFTHWEAVNNAAEQPLVHLVDSVLPIVAAGQSQLVPMDHEVEDGLWLEPMIGHSPGHVGINVEDGGEHAIFIGDMTHHPLQLTYPDWCSGFCDDKPMAIKTRRDFCERAAETDLIVVPAHFPPPTFGTIMRDGDAYRFHYEGE